MVTFSLKRRILTKRLEAAIITLALITIIISLTRFATIRSGRGFTLPLTNHLSMPVSTKINAPDSTKPVNATLVEAAPKYVTAILSPEDNSFPRLECPALNRERYAYLAGKDSLATYFGGRPKYFFALNLYQKVEVLPRLMASIVEAMRLLGPQHCVLSIVEGRSTDGTWEVLQALTKDLETMGVRYHLKSSEIDPLAGDRIAGLAELRNLALEPLTSHPEKFAKDTTVVFVNDISLCAEDILELVHQRKYQNADMTCAMDWSTPGNDHLFYDVWIARGMTGDSFFNIPNSQSWDAAWNLFWNDPKAKEALEAHKPFQVFACWNGIAAFTAEPLMQQKIKFRSRYDGECYKGEPEFFCKDLWYHGYRKIAVVPSVNVEYSDENSRKVKAVKGFASQYTAEETDYKIEWEADPPATVKCMWDWSNQVFLPWDEALAEHKPLAP